MSVPHNQYIAPCYAGYAQSGILPDDLIKEIARYLVQDIIAFFETEEARREFEEWKLEQEKRIAVRKPN